MSYEGGGASRHIGAHTGATEFLLDERPVCLLPLCFAQNDLETVPDHQGASLYPSPCLFSNMHT